MRGCNRGGGRGCLLRQGQREREQERREESREGGESVRREARRREHATAAIGHHDHRRGREWRTPPERARDAGSTIQLHAFQLTLSAHSPNNGPQRCMAVNGSGIQPARRPIEPRGHSKSRLRGSNGGRRGPEQIVRSVRLHAPRVVGAEIERRCSRRRMQAHKKKGGRLI